GAVDGRPRRMAPATPAASPSVRVWRYLPGSAVDGAVDLVVRLGHGRAVGAARERAIDCIVVDGAPTRVPHSLHFPPDGVPAKVEVALVVRKHHATADPVRLRVPRVA